MDKKELFNNLTIKEKISLFDGLNTWQTRPIDRVNLKSVWLSDGPHGLRKEILDNSSLGFSNTIKSICFPTSSLLSCSFDKNMAFLQGKSIGIQALYNDVNMILGPGINIKRHPLGGRNFEYLSEDPYLSGTLAKYYIRGTKSVGISCCIKHYALNNQEYNRFTYSSDCDIHTMFDTYLKAFNIVILDNNVDAVMAAYNLINGTYACENNYLLNDVLRKQFKFNGFVVSDWGAVNNYIQSFKNGLNLVMPGNNKHIVEDLYKLYENGELETASIDKAIWPIYSYIYDHQNIDKSNIKYDKEELYNNAYEIAKNSIVLAKNNNNILPLDNNEEVAILGQLAKQLHIQGGGSSKINCEDTHQVIDILTKDGYKFKYADGYDIKNNCSNDYLIKQACEISKGCKKVILFLGLFDELESEGRDKDNMNIPSYMVDLFNEVYSINKNIVLVLISGSPLEIPFIDKVDGVILPYLSGDRGADALIDILYGKVNPSGHLSETWPYKLEDTYLKDKFPIKNKNVLYSEGVYVGYKYYQYKNIKPMFCFGHGLTYSEVKYSNFKLKDNKISFTIENLSNRATQEVVLLYIEDEVNHLKTLVDFNKYEIKALSKINVVIDINDDYFKSYSQTYNDYVIKSSNYKISIGTSIENILYECFYKVKGKEEPYKYEIDLDIKQSDLVDNTYKGKYDMNSSLRDFQNSFLGRQFVKIIISQFKKHVAKDSPNFSFMLNEMLNMPFRGVISWANNDALSYKNGLVILDILNGKYIKGVKAFFKK